MFTLDLPDILRTLRDIILYTYKKAYEIEEARHMLPHIPFLTLELLEFGQLIFRRKFISATLSG